MRLHKIFSYAWMALLYYALVRKGLWVELGIAIVTVIVLIDSIFREVSEDDERLKLIINKMHTVVKSIDSTLSKMENIDKE